MIVTDKSNNMVHGLAWKHDDLALDKAGDGLAGPVGQHHHVRPCALGSAMARVAERRSS